MGGRNRDQRARRLSTDQDEGKGHAGRAPYNEGEEVGRMR